MTDALNLVVVVVAVSCVLCSSDIDVQTVDLLKSQFFPIDDANANTRKVLVLRGAPGVVPLTESSELFVLEILNVDLIH